MYIDLLEIDFEESGSGLTSELMQEPIYRHANLTKSIKDMLLVR